MDSALYGLVGAALGASAALLGAFFTHRFADRREKDKDFRDTTRERDRWLRDQKQSCYHNTVRCLARLQSVAGNTKNGKLLRLREDVPPSWFEEVAETNAWLTSLHYCCGENQYDAIGEVSAEFANLSRWLIGIRPTGTISSMQFEHVFLSREMIDFDAFVDILADIENTVANCARHEFQIAPTLPTVGKSIRNL